MKIKKIICMVSLCLILSGCSPDKKKITEAVIQINESCPINGKLNLSLEYSSTFGGAVKIECAWIKK